MTSGQDIDGIQRQYCDNCGYIDFIDPKVVAVAIVVNQKRELLLVKRNIEPLWENGLFRQDMLTMEKL